MVKIVVTVTFLVMIIINALANILPINGVTTGQVSASYPSLFTPAAQTFAIWGVIYLLLAAHTLYQLGFFHGNAGTFKKESLNKIGIIFSFSSIVNALWIFSWHYYLIPLSVFFILIIFACLFFVNQVINTERLTTREKLFIGLPFSIYFGWITVASIANVTVLLVSLGWNGFYIYEETLTFLLILFGLAIGTGKMLKNRDVAYGLVLIWAYAGILIKHTSTNGFSGQYPNVIYAAIASIILLLAAVIYILVTKENVNQF